MAREPQITSLVHHIIVSTSRVGTVLDERAGVAFNEKRKRCFEVNIKRTVGVIKAIA